MSRIRMCCYRLEQKLLAGWCPAYFTSPRVEASRLVVGDLSNLNVLLSTLNSATARFIIVNDGRSMFKYVGNGVAPTSTLTAARGIQQLADCKAVDFTSSEVTSLLGFPLNNLIQLDQNPIATTTDTKQQYSDVSNTIIAFLGSVKSRHEPFSLRRNSTSTEYDAETHLVYFALDISNLPHFVTPDNHFLTNLLNIQPQYLNDVEATLLSKARGLLLWHRTHVFCTFCGYNTKANIFGSHRICLNTACHNDIFPRLNPAIISLVTHDEYCLLGSKMILNNNRLYSAIAGFCEIGEAVEQTVIREVWEETGVEIESSSLHFVCSQPWLFPNSIMLSFLVNAKDMTLRENAVLNKPQKPPISPVSSSSGGWVCNSLGENIWLQPPACHDNELAVARWFHYSSVRAALTEQQQTKDDEGTESQTLKLPPSYAVANLLISKWLDLLHDKQPI